MNAPASMSLASTVDAAPAAPAPQAPAAPAASPAAPPSMQLVQPGQTGSPEVDDDPVNFSLDMREDEPEVAPAQQAAPAAGAPAQPAAGPGEDFAALEARAFGLQQAAADPLQQQLARQQAALEQMQARLVAMQQGYPQAPQAPQAPRQAAQQAPGFDPIALVRAVDQAVGEPPTEDPAQYRAWQQRRDATMINALNQQSEQRFAAIAQQAFERQAQPVAEEIMANRAELYAARIATQYAGRVGPDFEVAVANEIYDSMRRGQYDPQRLNDIGASTFMRYQQNVYRTFNQFAQRDPLFAKHYAAFVREKNAQMTPQAGASSGQQPVAQPSQPRRRRSNPLED